MNGLYLSLGCLWTAGRFPSLNIPLYTNLSSLRTRMCQVRHFFFCGLVARAATLIGKSLVDHGSEPSQRLFYSLHVFTSFPWYSVPVAWDGRSGYGQRRWVMSLASSCRRASQRVILCPFLAHREPVGDDEFVCLGFFYPSGSPIDSWNMRGAHLTSTSFYNGRCIYSDGELFTPTTKHLSCAYTHFCLLLVDLGSELQHFHNGGPPTIRRERIVPESEI